MLTTVWTDLKQAARSLAKARAFTFVCVISLGIGMAPVMAIPHLTRIFTIPPAGVDTTSLVEILTTRVNERAATDRWSYPDYTDLRDANTGLTLVGWLFGESELRESTTTSARAMFVSTNYFPTIGVALARGAGFGATREPEVIVGYRYWQNHFSSDQDIVGKTLILDDLPHTVVGIAPDGFESHVGFNGGVNVYLPLERHPRFRTAGTDRGNQWLLIHGRLAPGNTVAQASAAIATITTGLATQYPATNENKAGMAAPWSALGVLASSQVRIIQAVAMTLTGMVLLVVCLNISGMVQVRSAMRERELSIRQAIGASRRQLIQYLLGEALIMAALGAVIAATVLFNLPSILPLLTDETIPAPALDALRINLSTVGSCLAICLLTTLVCGLLPSARFSRPVIISSLKDDAGTGGQRAGRVHRITAALQVAIAVPLIVMSGISLDRVRSTATADLGFASDLLYAVPLKIDNEKVANADFAIRRVRDTLARTEGVAAATLADGLPLAFRYANVRTALRPEANAAPRFMQVHVTRVENDYLSAMAIPLLRGRGFTGEDRAGTELVTVISKPLADRLFPNADAGEAIGKQLIFGNDDKSAQTLTIVGVSGDFPTSQMSTEREQLLLPLAQQPSQDLFLIARSRPGEQPQRMTATLQNAVRDFDPENRGFGTGDGVKYPSVLTGVWLRENSMNDFLTQSMVSGVAGGVILTLSALGIYGVVGLMVATRTRELAVRMALGAARRRVIAMVLFDVVKLVVPGVVLGLMLTVALMRINAENMGISLSGVENVSYAVGAIVAVLIALAASLAPARRAASVAPMVALRSE